MSVGHYTLSREEALPLVRRWGQSTADASLEPEVKYFTIPEVKGTIGYRTEAGVAVTFGDPICSEEDKPQLAEAFHKFCKSQGLDVIYLIASESFTKWAHPRLYPAVMEFGEELFLNPCQDDPRNGKQCELIRKKIRQASRAGIKVQEYKEHDLDIEKSIQQVADAWLESRSGPQVYIAKVRLFDDRDGKRWFFAKQGHTYVGMALLHRLDSRNGWLLSELMFTPNAPQGTQEMLVLSALDALNDEHCSFLTFGAVPNTELGIVEGFGPLGTWVSRNSYTLARKVFHLDGKKVFWDKFNPRREKTFLMFSNPTIGIRGLHALVKAMNMSLA